jgi:hypothetical protein
MKIRNLVNVWGRAMLNISLSIVVLVHHSIGQKL